jgi:hypothetical protein
MKTYKTTKGAAQIAARLEGGLGSWRVVIRRNPITLRDEFVIVNRTTNQYHSLKGTGTP